MDDFATEQQNEIEVLKSIFFEEFIELEPDNIHHYALIIHPDEDAFTDLLTHEEAIVRRKWKLYLEVNLPEDYPSSAPKLSVSRYMPRSGDATEGEDADDDDSSTAQDSDDEDDVDESHYLYLDESVAYDLESWAESTAADMLGEVVIFSVVNALRERLAALITKRVKEFHMAEAERIAREEAAEAAKFQGTSVTRERFLAWKARFNAKMAALKSKAQAAAAPTSAASKKAAAAAAARLTGKQQFEQDKTLVSSDSAFIGDDDISVDVSLFTEEELLQVGEIDLEDDEDGGVAALLMKNGDD